MSLLQFEFALIVTYLSLGYAVVVTDYQRFGPPNVHTFANSKAAGQAVLDAARAATRVSGAGLTNANPLAITGYSQGGNGSAAAAERQPSYAPELNVKGVATGGVPADLRATANAVDRDFLFGVLPMAIASLKAAYPELSLDQLNDAGRAAVEDVKDDCMPETTTKWAFHSAIELTQGGRTIDQFLDAQPSWKARVDQQRIGRLEPEAPVLVYHGVLDPWVPYAVGRRLADDWCAQGANVQFATYPLAEHFGGLIEAIPQVQAWLAARLAGVPARSRC